MGAALLTPNRHIQAYINNFRRHMARFLKPGIGMKCVVYPAETGGAILAFQIGSDVENDDIFKVPTATLGKALSKIEQKAFAGNLEGFVFRGTNVILEANRLILIKDGERSQWFDSAAIEDVHRVVSSGRTRAP